MLRLSFPSPFAHLPMGAGAWWPETMGIRLKETQSPLSPSPKRHVCLKATPLWVPGSPRPYK